MPEQLKDFMIDIFTAMAKGASPSEVLPWSQCVTKVNVSNHSYGQRTITAAAACSWAWICGKPMHWWQVEDW